MTQSVELLLDPDADAAVRSAWRRLHEAGLPSEQRAPGPTSHQPHVTLYAADELGAPESALAELASGLALTVELGALTLFGPHRDRYVLVHQLVPTTALLELQARVARCCRADPRGYFAPGRWTPHVTVVRRLPPELVGQVLDVLQGGAAGQVCHLTQVRRWDSVARRSWLL